MIDLANALKTAKAGETLQLPPGRYTGTFEITKPVVLIARGQVVLDAQHAGPCLTIRAAGTVRISGVTFVGGNATEAGGAISLDHGRLELVDSVVRFNKAPSYGGGGLFLGGDATAVVSRCRFEGNTARQGGAILVDGTATLRLEHSALIQNAAVDGGGLRVKEGASVDVFGCTIADNKVVGDTGVGGALHASGTSSRAPTVKLSHCVVSERAKGPACVFVAGAFPASVAIERSLLPEWCKELGVDCVHAAAGFVGSGSEPYLLADSSPAVGKGDARLFAPGAKDVLGRACVETGRADLGAFAHSRQSQSSIGY